MVGGDKGDVAESIAKSVERVADSKGLVAIGDALGIGLVVIGFALVMAAIFFGSKWDGRLFPEPKCYELQEISDKVFRVNTCTGDAVEVEITDGDPD